MEILEGTLFFGWEIHEAWFGWNKECALTG